MEPGQTLAEAVVKGLKLSDKVSKTVVNRVHRLVDKVRTEVIRDYQRKLEDQEYAAVQARLEYEKEIALPRRERLPETRNSVTRVLRMKWSDVGSEVVCDHCGGKVQAKPREFDVYVTAGTYPDGRLGEFFLRAGKEGGTLAGVLDALAMAVSVGLQHGIALEVYADKLKGTKFEPDGYTGDPEFPNITSPLDYVFRWLEARFNNKGARA